jgi:hypothetical protein
MEFDNIFAMTTIITILQKCQRDDYNIRNEDQIPSGLKVNIMVLLVSLVLYLNHHNRGIWHTAQGFRLPLGGKVQRTNDKRGARRDKGSQIKPSQEINRHKRLAGNELNWIYLWIRARDTIVFPEPGLSQSATPLTGIL